MRRVLTHTWLLSLAAVSMLVACDEGASVGPDPDGEPDAGADADAPPDCVEDPDCALGQLCRSGRCVEGCASSRDCPGGLHCDTTLGEHGRCVACMEDADCDGGNRCVNGACVNSCASDDDCPPVRPLCDASQSPPMCVACMSVDDCPLLNLCLNGACVEGCESVRDCPLGWYCDTILGDHGRCFLPDEPEPDPEPEVAADADAAPDAADDPPDLWESDPEPEPDRPPDDKVDDPPLDCDEAYNLSRGRGSLEADVQGRGADDRFRSTDVLFRWQDAGADRPMLVIEAKEWCRYGMLKANLTISCLLRQEDLGLLPLEINLTNVFIAGSNSCKAAYSDRRAVFRPRTGGSIVFEGYAARASLGGRFDGAEVGEATDPSNVLVFEKGSFDSISGE